LQNQNQKHKLRSARIFFNYHEGPLAAAASDHASSLFNPGWQLVSN